MAKDRLNDLARLGGKDAESVVQEGLHGKESVNFACSYSGQESRSTAMKRWRQSAEATMLALAVAENNSRGSLCEARAFPATFTFTCRSPERREAELDAPLAPEDAPEGSHRAWQSDSEEVQHRMGRGSAAASEELEEAVCEAAAKTSREETLSKHVFTARLSSCELKRKGAT